ncbi:MAG TPA: Crp/Fnr family transcriptional regulator [Dongiaceae bacterium]|jgi:CRP-like cAMP-binding protein
MGRLDQSERQTLIRRSFLFRDVAQPILEQLSALSVTKHLERRETLLSRGDEGDALYVVVEGLVRIWVGSESGKELTFSMMEPGDVFGEIALLDGLPRTANATAQEATLLLVIQRSAFLSVLEGEPTLARHIIELLCERMRLKTDLLSDFAFADLPVRLARKLDDLVTAHGEIDGNVARLGRRFSQTELAQMLGVSREAINKQLAAWSHKGIVSTEEGGLTVLNLSGLRAQGAPEHSV